MRFANRENWCANVRVKVKVRAKVRVRVRVRVRVMVTSCLVTISYCHTGVFHNSKRPVPFSPWPGLTKAALAVRVSVMVRVRVMVKGKWKGKDP